MYKILIDSCGELTEEMKAGGHFATIPLILQIDGKDIIDDETFDQADFLAKVALSPDAPHSACPSPDAYMSAMEGDADHIYVVTLSSQLSGSYSSACLGAELYLEDIEDEDGEEKHIHVFDSKSASIGQTLIGLKIQECEEAGMSFEEVIAAVDAYIEEQHTFFTLESLETLRKAGRLSGVKAMLVKALNIKPVMGSTPEGTIQQLDQGRGMIKAMDKMASSMLAVTENCEDKILAISHCNAPALAQVLKTKIEKIANFKEIIILDTQGVSSMYANDGGIIMAV